MKNDRASLRKKRRRKRRRQIFRRLLFISCLFLFLIVFLTEKKGSTELSKQMSRLAEQGDIPQSLIDLAERNPETINFVSHYPKGKEKADKINITKDLKKGGIPLFLQWDERWGYETYGDNYLAITGCGPTSLSMVYCGLTGDDYWNPYQLAIRAEEDGYYVSGCGTAWSLMEDFAKEIGLKMVDVRYEKEDIIRVLADGHPIIAIMGPGDFTDKGHFIVLTGVDDDGKVIVNDPNSKKNSKQTWDVETLMRQMKNLWGYTI